MQPDSLPRHSELVRVKVWDDRFRRQVTVSYMTDDPGRLMFAVDGAGGLVVSTEAFTKIRAAFGEQEADSVTT